MVTPALVDLEVALYEDLYGRVGAQILDLLLNKGRATAPEIAKHTGLAPSAVQRTLVSLVTNRFVLFWQRSPRTYYFANSQKLYSLLWMGQLVGQLDPELRGTMLKTAINGLTPFSPELQPLIDAKLLCVASDWEFWPEEELLGSLESEKTREVQSNPETMGKSEAAKRAQVVADAQRELHRIHANGNTGSSSSSSSSFSSSSSSSSSVGPLYRVNFNKFLVEARRHELASFTARTIGEITAQVYEIVLKLSERDIDLPKQARVPCPETVVTTQDVLAAMPAELMAVLASAFQQKQNHETGGGKDGDGEDVEVKEESSAKRAKSNSGSAINLANVAANALSTMKPAELVNKHLDLLVESKAANFVQRVGSRQAGEWFVPFDKVVADLQQSTFDEIVSMSLGEPAARLIRLIRVTGKLDEKMLGNHALLPSLEIRHQMSALSYYGFADIQELAKPNDRNSGAGAQKRSLFLWHHRPQWAYSRLVDLLYTQLLSALRETQELRTKHAILINKLNREDVKSDINQFLTEREREELAEYKQKECDAYKRMNMIDRHVRIFREY